MAGQAGGAVVPKEGNVQKVIRWANPGCVAGLDFCDAVRGVLNLEYTAIAPIRTANGIRMVDILESEGYWDRIKTVAIEGKNKKVADYAFDRLVANRCYFELGAFMRDKRVNRRYFKAERFFDAVSEAEIREEVKIGGCDVLAEFARSGPGEMAIYAIDSLFENNRADLVYREVFGKTRDFATERYIVRKAAEKEDWKEFVWFVGKSIDNPDISEYAIGTLFQFDHAEPSVLANCTSKQLRDAVAHAEKNGQFEYIRDIAQVHTNRASDYAILILASNGVWDEYQTLVKEQAKYWKARQETFEFSKIKDQYAKFAYALIFTAAKKGEWEIVKLIENEFEWEYAVSCAHKEQFSVKQIADFARKLERKKELGNTPGSVRN